MIIIVLIPRPLPFGYIKMNQINKDYENRRLNAQIGLNFLQVAHIMTKLNKG